jgi:ribosomal protein S7
MNTGGSMKIKFEKKDVMEILKKHVETLMPGSKVESVKSEYDGYECDVETTPQKKEGE